MTDFIWYTVFILFKFPHTEKNNIAACLQVCYLYTAHIEYDIVTKLSALTVWKLLFSINTCIYNNCFKVVRFKFQNHNTVPRVSYASFQKAFSWLILKSTKSYFRYKNDQMSKTFIWRMTSHMESDITFAYSILNLHLSELNW